MRLRLMAKLLFITGMLLMGIAAGVVYARIALGTTQADAITLYDLSRGSEIANAVNADFLGYDDQMNMMAAVATANKALIKPTYAQAEQFRKNLDADIQRLLSTPGGRFLAPVARDLRRDVKVYDRLAGQVYALDLTGKTSRAIYIQTVGNLNVSNRIGHDLSKLLSGAKAAIGARSQALEAQIRFADNFMLITGLLAIVFGVLVSVYFSRWLVGNLDAIRRQATAIATGDLTMGDLTVRSRDEVGELAQAFNKMSGDLRALLGQIAQSARLVSTASGEVASAAGQVATASQQITMAVQQVATGATEQSASAEETVSVVTQLRSGIMQVAQGAQDQARNVGVVSETIKQMAVAIQDVASSSQDVSAAAAAVLAAAERGGSDVRDTVNGMARIRDASQRAADRVLTLGESSVRIGEIVAVISGIADQTNLLALNAAIEAARAGEHGKGFAVVADEVRKLAENSNQATKEIGQLIDAIRSEVAAAVEAMSAGGREVEAGTQLADRAGKALEQILESMRRTHGYVQSISAAAEEVAASVDAAVSSVDDVAGVTEENLAATEGMTAFSDRVAESAQSVAAISAESAASVEEVTATTEEVGASVEEISASASSLAGTARGLEQLVAHFKL